MGLGFRFQDLGFRFRVEGGGHNPYSSVNCVFQRIQAVDISLLGFRVSGSGFRVWGLGFRVPDFKLLGPGFGDHPNRFTAIRHVSRLNTTQTACYKGISEYAGSGSPIDPTVANTVRA